MKWIVEANQKAIGGLGIDKDRIGYFHDGTPFLAECRNEGNCRDQ